MRKNTRLMVKQAGLAIPYPVKMTPDNLMASCVITVDLVKALRGHAIFQTADRTACMRRGWLAVWHPG